jgi:hypothetical protein
MVLLSDGSRIVAAAAWAGGAPVELAGGVLVVKSDSFDDVRVPLAQVRGLVFAERSRPQERKRIEDLVRSTAAASDEVLLTNDDRLSGKVIEIQSGTLTLAMRSGEAKLPLSRVVAVEFAKPQVVDRPGRAAGRFAATARFVVSLRDGSLLYAASARGNAKELDVQLADSDVRLAGGTVGDVVGIESLGGDRFVYLSDREPSEFRHVPYLSIEWPYQRNRNVLGEPLSAGGNRNLHGLGMHSAARLTYRLDAKWGRFEADVAIDDSAGGRGSVTFGVHVLRDGKWQTAFTSGVVHGGEAARPVAVDISNAQSLTLTVDYADRGDELDHADWLGARLVE